MKPKRSLSLLAGLLLGVILLLEIFARTQLPDIPAARDVPRNPFRYRGWPEYIDGLAQDGGSNRVVLLTNCQGYGGEYPASRGYPARLEWALRARYAGDTPAWHVLNWAIDGATSMEYLLLASYLRHHPPAVVIAVTGYADYRNEHFREGLAYCRTDVPRLICRRDVLRTIPAGFKRRHLKVEDSLSAVLSHNLGILRYKEYLWSWIDRRVPGAHNVFYAPDFSYTPWYLPRKPLLKPIQLPENTNTVLRVTYGEGSREMLREYLEQLSGIPTQVVVVSEPTTTPEDDPHERLFLADLGELTRELGLVYWDLHDALPAKHFFSTAHFHRNNHVRMAALLGRRIAELREGRLLSAGERDAIEKAVRGGTLEHGNGEQGTAGGEGS